MNNLDVETQLRLLNLERFVLLDKLKENFTDVNSTYGNPRIEAAQAIVDRLAKNLRQIYDLVN